MICLWSFICLDIVWSIWLLSLGGQMLWNGTVRILFESVLTILNLVFRDDVTVSIYLFRQSVQYAVLWGIPAKTVGNFNRLPVNSLRRCLEYFSNSDGQLPEWSLDFWSCFCFWAASQWFPFTCDGILLLPCRTSDSEQSCEPTELLLFASLLDIEINFHGRKKLNWRFWFQHDVLQQLNLLQRVRVLGFSDTMKFQGS